MEITLSPNHVNHVQICPTCQRKLSQRKVVFGRWHLTALVKAHHFLLRNPGEMVEIKKIGLDNVEYANMNNLVNFGLAYREEEQKLGEYGLPLERVRDFFLGKWKVAAFYLVNPITKANIMSDHRISVFETPGFEKVRSELGDLFTEYLDNPDAKEIAVEVLVRRFSGGGRVATSPQPPLFSFPNAG